jgi:hypothetical protein
VIFYNPRGAPELACDHCGCRWVDRTNGAHCYECGEEITAESIAEFQRALQVLAEKNNQPGGGTT